MSSETEPESFVPFVPPAQVDGLNFPQAIQAIIDGKRITKAEWDDPRYFGEHRDSFLMLHKPDGSWHRWLVSDGDLFGHDWVILP